MYTVSQKAIKGSRPGNVSSRRSKPVSGNVAQSRSVCKTSPSKQQASDDAKRSLEEILFGEEAEATLLLQSRAASIVKPAKTFTTDMKEASVSPEAFIAAYRHNVTESEAGKTKLAENEQRQAVLRSELQSLEEEAGTITAGLRRSKAERKRLRTSLSARDLAFLQAGQDLAHDGAKRLRVDRSDEE